MVSGDLTGLERKINPFLMKGIRCLDKAKVEYQIQTYDVSEAGSTRNVDGYVAVLDDETLYVGLPESEKED